MFVRTARRHRQRGRTPRAAPIPHIGHRAGGCSSINDTSHPASPCDAGDCNCCHARINRHSRRSSSQLPRHDRAWFNHLASSPQQRPPFGVVAKRLLKALDAALALFKMLLDAHERETRALRGFAGARVLDVVWCARVWCERVGEEGEGEGDGKNGSEDAEGGGDEESMRERVGGVVRRTGRALGDVAGARVGGTANVGTDGVGREEEERRVREKVKEVEKVFGRLVEGAMQKVGAMRYLVVELELLRAVLTSVLEKD